MMKSKVLSLGSSGGDDETQSDVRQLKEGLGLQQLIGKSPMLLATLKRLRAAAGSIASVLILGERGTGKEMCARAIHANSGRVGKFVPLNCASIRSDRAENDLFGHVRGAFTGADCPANGVIQDAEAGTVFLDEFNSLVLEAQPILLRFLEDRQFRQVGSTKLCVADVRFIAAANADLERMARVGRFREDLFDRINVIPISLPALRDRREDIPLLAEHFLQEFARLHGRLSKTLTSEALKKLILCDWPGNMREFKNVMERLVLLFENRCITPDDIERARDAHPAKEAMGGLRTVTHDAQKRLIANTLTACKGRTIETARALGIGERHLRRLIRAHHLTYRPPQNGASASGQM